MPIAPVKTWRLAACPEGMETPKPSSRFQHWLRVLRPLSWWILMVLLMYAYRTHQRLSARTTIAFTPTLAERPVAYESTARLDDKLADTGQHISIGWHTLTITHLKTRPFSTNLFIWYGEHDLGKIPLERTKGLLAVKAEPRARWVTIRGPEFWVTLTNTSGLTSSVPTDRYVVEAYYKYWKRQQEVTVIADQTAAQTFAPKLGAVRITASHADVSYQFRRNGTEVLESGDLPATISELPEGEYRLISQRMDDEREMRVGIKGEVTNDINVEFVYGSALLQSDPSGATVLSGGKEYGVTPLVLSELKPGTFEFSLRLADYEAVGGALTVTANETNNFRASLLRLDYTRAMASARRSYADKDYERAAQVVTEALKYKPDDTEAKALQRGAMGLAHLSRAEAMGQRGDYAVAILEVNAARAYLPENSSANELLADFSAREQQRIEAEQKRAAEQAEQERRKREAELAERTAREKIRELHESFNVLLRGFENSGQFAEHELVTTNTVGVAGVATKEALASGEPSFKIVRFEQTRPDIFGLQARQMVDIGYRDCLVVGEQVRDHETRILFKVLEYDHPPETKLLGGALTINARVNSDTTQSARFQQRIPKGIAIVRERIQSAIARIPATKE